MELITKYREFQARPADRARMEQELLKTKTDTEQNIRMNLLRETQSKILAELERKLEEVRAGADPGGVLGVLGPPLGVPTLERINTIYVKGLTSHGLDPPLRKSWIRPWRAPLPDTLVKFLSDTARLEKEIAGVGEIIEEVPVVPQYAWMSCVVAVGKQGHDPGELMHPEGVAVDENTGSIYIAEGLGSYSRVSVFSETGDFLNSFSHQYMTDWGIALHRDNIYVTEYTDTVFHLKMEQQIRHVATFGGVRGSSDKQLYYPSGLTVSTDGDVFVADRNNNRIKILDESLRFERHVTH